MSSSRLLAAGTSRRLKAMNDVTRILSAIEQGDPQAAEQLLPLVYDELRKLAAARMAAGEARPDPPGHRPGPRGVPAAGRRRALRLGQPRPLLRRRGGSHAAHPGQPCSGSEAAEAGGRAETARLLDQIGSVAEDPALVLSLDELLTRLGEEDAVAARVAAAPPVRRAFRRGGGRGAWGSPGRWLTETGSTPGPGSARPWENNSKSVRHFSPGWGIESMPCRWGSKIMPGPGGEPWPLMPRERNPCF